ncbi:MAG: hypothetical protein OHK006_01560 [Thermodesulfovibrionales bacterium]
MSDYVKKRPVGKMVLTGITSVALYGALLMNQDLINASFSRGGLFAVLPIVTAFVFSFIHGSFTGSFWSVLGVEASKRKGVK